MNKLLCVFALLMLASNQAFSIYIEGHGQCESFKSHIKQLNNGSYFEYEVWEDYLYDENDEEIPSCVFSKKTIGGVDLEFEITQNTSFLEVNTKIEDFEQRITNITKKRSEGQKYCHYTNNYFFVSSDTSQSKDTFTLSLGGELRCLSQDDLSYLENLDFTEILKKATKDTDIKFKILSQPSPVVSGTTIHN